MIDEIKQVGTVGELLNFVKSNKDSKILFKEENNSKVRGADSKSDETWENYHRDVCLAIKSHRLHCCCGQKFYSEDQLQVKLLELADKIDSIVSNSDFWEMNVPGKAQTICVIDGDDLQMKLNKLKGEIRVSGSDEN